jgi:hypothetical protein
MSPGLGRSLARRCNPPTTAPRPKPRN